MTDPLFEPRSARHLLESGGFASALSLAIVGLAFSSFAVRQMIGWPGEIGALSCLVILAAASFIARHRAVQWRGLLPLSLLAYVLWCTLSIGWSSYPGASIESAIYLWCFAFLGIYLALVRDTIQLVRVVGDVLRFMLCVSLGIEVLSAFVLRANIPVLTVNQGLATLGPIEGVFGTRNALGLASLIALVTYVVEVRTHSIGRLTGWLSVGLAIVCALLSRSPVIALTLIVVVVAMIALMLVRRVRKPRQRLPLQITLSWLAVLAAGAAWWQRDTILTLLNARGLLDVRYPVWLGVWELWKQHPLTGWGWTGIWRSGQAAFALVNELGQGQQQNGLDAYLDVLLQLGVAGMLLLAILAALALGRSWLIASNRHSEIHMWVPLVLVALVTTSLAESSMLVDSGWLLLVVCAVKASQGLRWSIGSTHRGVSSAGGANTGDGSNTPRNPPRALDD